MKTLNLRNYSVIGLCVLASSAASANGLSASTFIGYGESPYKHTDPNSTALPLIQYEGDRFYLKGTNLGAYLVKERAQQFSVFAGYSPFSFDPSDSSDAQMRQLDERYTTGVFGLEYTRFTPAGIFSAKVTHDFLDTYNGFNADLSYGLILPVSPTVRIMPKAGLVWNSGDYNDYYFGVSSNEAARSGLAAYTADDSITPYVSVMTLIGLSERVSLSLSADARFLPDEVKDSPMVSEDTLFGATIGLGYSF